MAGALWKYRRYILTGALREIRQRYAGSVMGVVWHVLIPLIQIGVYYFVFSHFLRWGGANGEGGAYAISMCAGILPWFAFQEAVSQGAMSLVSNEAYLKKLAIPEPVFVAQTVATAGLSLSVYLVALVVLVAATGHAPQLIWFLILPVLMLFLSLAFGFALILAPLCVFFRDVGQLLGIVLQIWFWLTPILYDESMVGPALQTVIRWNPPAAHIAAVRGLLLRADAPSAESWTWMIGLALVLPVVGLLFLQQVHSEVRDAL